jgi:plasmid stability protein
MASITIRNIEDRLKTQLRVRAAEHGRSMEEEARCILREVLGRERPQSIVDLAREFFGPKHGVDLEPHPPLETPTPPTFEPE